MLENKAKYYEDVLVGKKKTGEKLILILSRSKLIVYFLSVFRRRRWWIVFGWFWSKSCRKSNHIERKQWAKVNAQTNLIKLKKKFFKSR